MTILKGWCFAFGCLFVSVCPSECTDLKERHFETVMDAFTLTLSYYDLMMKDKGTPDSTFGLAATLGQLQSLIDHIQNHPYRVEKKMHKVIDQLENAVKHIQSILQISINSTTEKYNSVFKDLFEEKMWQFFVPQRMTNPKLLYQNPANEDSEFNEELSDLCLSLLLGKGFVPIKCTIPDFCWTKMTTRGFYGYWLTHQLLYFMIAERVHCWDKLHNLSETFNQSSPKRMIEIFCSNILRESQEIAAKDFPITLRDLFLEQSTVCGMMGYREFFRPKWIKVILSWQHQSGCFSAKDNPTDPGRIKSVSSNHTIRKRLDTVLDDGCSSHFTALAITTFGQYFRYIVQDFLMKNQEDNRQS